MKYFFSFLISISFYLSANATHLVGGEMTYERLGGNTIRFTLTVYRDNFNGSPNAPFDGAPGGANIPEMVISIYNENGQFLEAREIDFNGFTNVPQELENCQDPLSNIDIQRAEYVFDINFSTVPGFNPNLLHRVIYGRCCRNGTINNLTNPGDQGFSAIAEVAPLNIQNDSPVFNNFYQYLCEDREALLDFSATDADGDSLYYTLCDPVLGLDPNIPAADAGNLNAGGTYINYGPPYPTVNWGFGFSATNPFGGPLVFGNNTGILQVTPPNSGVFTMAVCVQEYRNGVFLGSIFRDFQYLVSPCEFPDIEIATDPNIPLDPETGLFTIDTDCDQGIINFDLSVDNGISDYQWDFGVPGTNTDVASGPNVSYFYSDTGTYEVTVIGTAPDGCADTARGLVVFYPIFEPGYDFVDSCASTSVFFNDTSFSSFNDIIFWEWNFGDPNTTLDTANIPNPTYVYSEPGTYTASVLVSTEKGCQELVTNQITVHPDPEPDFTFPNLICEGDQITINNTSTIQTGSIADYLWDIDGNTFTSENVPFTFNSAGTYNISLIATSALECTDSTEQTLTVNPLPIIDAIPDDSICENTSIQLGVSGGVSYNWTPTEFLDNPAISNPTASLDTNDIEFFVIGTDAIGCSNIDSVTIFLFDPPDADAGEDTSVCLNTADATVFNQNVQLTATGGVTYNWNPSTGLSSTNTANTIATPSVNTTYEVLVTDGIGCTSTDTVRVTVLNPALDLIVNPTDSICFADTVFTAVNEQGAVSNYSWSPNTFITNDTINSPGFFPPVNTNYVLSVSNYCYQKEDTILIEVIPLPNVDAGQLDSICLGDPPYQLNASPNDLEIYEWTSTDPSISNPSIFNPTVSPQITSTYFLTATDSVGTLACVNSDSVEILVFNPPAIDIILPGDYPGYICLGDTIELEAITNDAIIFEWSANPNANFDNPNNQITNAIPIDSTQFNVLATNIHGCINEDSVFIPVQLPVTAQIAVDSMCFGTFANVEAAGGLYYDWFPSEIFSSSSLAVTQAFPDTSLEVSVEVSNDCFLDTASAFIEVFPLPEVDAGEDITVIRDDFTGFLQGSGSGDPVWYTSEETFDGILGSYFQYEIEVSPFNTTDYVLRVTDPITECLNYDTATVFVDVITLLAFPTGFSPNGDGVNDFARIIKYLNIERLINLSIYNRWGEIVFTTNDLDDTGWDGTYKTIPQEIGVHAWVIEAITKDGDRVLKKGNISLIR